MSKRKISSENLAKATKIVVDKILFRINASFGPHTNRKKFGAKIEMMYKDILPEFDSLSWVDLNVFGDLSIHCMEIIFEDYKNDLRYIWNEGKGRGIKEYHENISDMIVKICFEYRDAKVEMMEKFMITMAEFHDESLREVAKEFDTGFCFIATLIYEDYDHPNVLILRNFRDNVLKRNNIGRIFIKKYYLIGPKICDLMMRSDVFDKLVRSIVFGIVKVLNHFNLNR